jgi:hypothetical protein
MSESSSQPTNTSQAKFSSASTRLSGDQPGVGSQGPAESPEGGSDDDSGLIALGKQFDDIAATIRDLQTPSPDDHLELIESMLCRLEPVERAIMAAPARTVAGLGVKARHAAYVVSEYWDAPVDRIDWDARAVRLLIEALCDAAGVSLSTGSAANR